MSKHPKIEIHYRSFSASLVVLLLMFSAIFGFLQLDIARATSPNATQATISLTEPNGVFDKIAEGADYATQTWYDAWDMNESTDLSPYIFEIDNITLSGGIWSGVASGTDPQIYILHPGVLRSQVVGKIGENRPIDTSQYTRLSFRMYLEPFTGYDEARLFWFVDYTTEAGHSAPIPVYSGWHVYDLDLTTIEAGDSPGAWQDVPQVTGLRFDPTTTSGRDIQLDWIRLSSPPDATTDFNIQWTTNGLAGGEVVYLYADDDTNFSNGYLASVGGSAATTGAYTWNSSAFPPGDYYVQARMGIDYAGLARGDIWDMAESTDAATYQITNPTFSGGLLSGTSGSDAQVFPTLNPAQPIDGNFFDTFAFSMTLDTSDGWALFWWTTEGGPFLSGPYPAFSGSNLYNLDLSGNANWAGKSITTLRLDPVGSAGIDLQIDWIAVTTGAVPASEADLGIQTATSPGSMTINQAPILNVTKPSRTSGEDYATEVLNNPWNMDDSADVEVITNIPTYEFSGGLFTGSGVQDPGASGFSDPGLNMIYLDRRYPINTDRYHYLTYRIYDETPPNLSMHVGPPYLDVARVLWQEVDSAAYHTTVDFVVYYDTWEQFTIDLREALMEDPDQPPGGPPIPGGLWTGDAWTIRLDPHEAPEPFTAGTVPPSFSFDFVTLTADDTADASFDIQWTLNNPDEDVTVNLYYDTDTNPDNGKTLIGTTSQSAGGSEASSYSWDTSALEGAFYVYVAADDGFNTRGWYSESPVIVKRTPTVNVTDPDGVGDEINMGNRYGVNVLGDPWDMEESTDVESYNADFGTPTFSGGVMTTVTTGGDASFNLNVPAGQPIDADTYTKLILRMYIDIEEDSFQVFFTDDEDNTYWTDFFTAFSGWGEYAVYLDASSPQWTGMIKNLRIDPVTNSGVTVKVDWAVLVEPNSSTYTIHWASTNVDGSQVSIYYDSDNTGFDGFLIASHLDAATVNSYLWDTSNLDPGDYYIYAVIDNGVSPKWMEYGAGPITAVGPSVDVTEPNGVGDQIEMGTDFASIVLDDPWDMDNAEDIPSYSGLSGVSFSGGLFSATTTSSESEIWLVDAFDASSPKINADTYKKLVFRMYLDQASQYQITWVKGVFKQTALFEANAGWNDYVVDLSAYPDWSGEVTGIRIDPTTVSGSNIQLDWAKLVVANSSTYNIQWSTSNAGGAKVSLFYADTCVGFSGTRIASGLASSTTNYVWDTSFLDPGSYYVYAKIGAGVSAFYDCAAGPLTVLGPTVDIQQPDGTGDDVLLGREYAATVLDNPWDMDNSEDIPSYSGLGSVSFSGGILSAVTTNTDPHLWLVDAFDPTSPSINAATYNKIVFRMYLDQASQYQIIWVNGGFQQSAYLEAKAGWNEYVVDLSSYPSWNGEISGIRIDPTTVSGSNIQLDWAKLVTGNFSTYNIQWSTGNAGGATVSLFYADTCVGYSGTRIASGLTSATTNYVWDTSFLDPGSYYVYAKIGSGSSAAYDCGTGPITVLSPDVEVQQPDGLSDRIPLGTDYATTVIGNPWDMNDAADVPLYENMSGVTFANGIFSGVSTSSDPAIWLVNPFDPQHPDIDADTYNKLAFRMDLDQASQYQLIWMKDGAFKSSDLFDAKSGWHEYVVDLSGYADWSGVVTGVRIDPTLVSGSTIELDWVKLVPANFSTFNISWANTNPGGAVVSLYYSANCFSYNGSLIASGFESGATSYLWDASYLDAGAYYIYAKIGSGVSTAYDYGAGPITVGDGDYPNQCLAGLEAVYLPLVQR